MTLRYRAVGTKQIPVGLDWNVCNDGNPDPAVWNKKLKPNEPGVTAELKRAGGFVQRLAAEIEEEVIRLYRDEKWSATMVAEKVNIRQGTVFKVLRRNNIPSRSKSEGMALSPRYQARHKLKETAS